MIMRENKIFILMIKGGTIDELCDCDTAEAFLKVVKYGSNENI